LKVPWRAWFCAAGGTPPCHPRAGFSRRDRDGRLDDPRQFGAPKLAIDNLAKQPFHHIPEDLPTFESLPKHRSFVGDGCAATRGK
jgi:hypothetical protein